MPFGERIYFDFKSEKDVKKQFEDDEHNERLKSNTRPIYKITKIEKQKLGKTKIYKVHFNELQRM